MKTPALIAAGLLLVAVVLADLTFSPRYMRRVRAAVMSGDRAARTRMYRLTVVVTWWAALGAIAVMLGGGRSASEIGFGPPRVGTLERYAAPLAGAVLAIVAAGLAAVIASRRGRARAVPLVGDVDVILPRGRTERRWFTLVAITAGITEEVFYRAFALTFLLAVLPGGRWSALLVAAVLFGAAHLYQGVGGVAITAVLAILLGWLYLDTGSLLPGMVLHILVDLRALLVRQPTETSRRATSN
ncbi:MAG: CPBP family intramembrane metalloprotease [Candidatus Dormibacteraeota bacterium]|uniref:CPBP family intramembrane metalloprotease n=1 Tax=Candidatus Amunia macphersoniae TaxID=3127014 RepID=A0A934KHY0_9BACT|nr:CPBP family intramembrane metalloprotease [Candidatus Dormibacteraeota bacterium]